MKKLGNRLPLIGVLFLCGCASSSHSTGTGTHPLPTSAGPNWGEVDKTVQRVKQAEGSKRMAIETERTVEAGFFPMTDDEYATALDSARTEVRKANPKMSDNDVEAEATKRADEARRRQELSFTRRASSTYELKRP